MASFNQDYMLWWPQNPRTAQRGPMTNHTVQRGHSGYAVQRSIDQGHDRMCYAVRMSLQYAQEHI